MRTDREKMRDTKVLNIVKMICIAIMIAYCFFNSFLLDHIGGFICLVATSFMVVPRYLINRVLDNLDEDE